MFQPHFLQYFWIEALFTTIIIILSFIIFVKTSDLYKLTKHKGIEYFRNSFLLFGFSFLAKLAFPLTRLFVRGPNTWIYYLSFLYLFLSTLAVLFLLYGLLWKHLTKIKIKTSYLPYLIAIIITIFSDTGRFRQGINLGQIFLLVLVAVIAIYNYLMQKKKHLSIYVLYILLFFSITIHNIAFFTIRLSTILGIGLYLVSSALFFVIMYKVWYRTK